jgi:hypothetical protein
MSPHGTANRYRRGKCRCEACTRACRDAARRARNGDQPSGLVPVAPIRAHLLALHDAGETWRQIADRIGYSMGAIYGIATGRQQSVQAMTALDILATDPLPKETAA